MIISRFLKLHELGFNVPTFVQNPQQKYKEGLSLSLQSYVFPPASKVTLLAERGEKEKRFSELSIQEAIAILTDLAKRGYEILLMEWPEWEFLGKVTWNKEYRKGVFRRHNHCLLPFSFVESVEGVRERYIIRTCQEVGELLDVANVEILYGWATRFIGVKCLKLIIYDYKILENSLDK